jgi:ketosteroid isomerase-like protein
MSERSATGRPALADVPAWVREHYALVDAAELDRYVADFAADVELRFASRPPVHGREAVRNALAAGHTKHEMEHTVINCWEVGDTTILEFDVVYTFPDGHNQAAPSVALVRRDADGLIASLRVYLQPPR